MTHTKTSHLAIASSLPSPHEAFDDVRDSFERFCLLSGIEAMNLMLINVSTRKFGRAVCLPSADGMGGDIPVQKGDGTSKSAASRRFVVLSAVKMKEWMGEDLSKLDLLVIQIDGLHIKDELVMIAAVGIDADGHKHPLAVVEGASENTATVQALLDDLVERGLDPKICRLFILDGAKALKKAVRNTFGKHTPIQRCQIHKARNIIDRLPKDFHATAKKALRQAWEMDDADKGEKAAAQSARRMENEAPGVSGSILEGIDDILTLTRLGLPEELRRSLACTNIIENMMGTIRRVTRNVKRWRNTKMALRWTAAGMMEAKKGFRRIRAYKQLPQLQAALLAHQKRHQKNDDLDRQDKAALIGSALSQLFNIERDIVHFGFVLPLPCLCRGIKTNQKRGVWGNQN